MARPDPVRWKVLSPLLDELLDTDPGERQARLESLRREDPLLAGELEAFLAHSAAADREQFLAGVAAPVEASLEGKTVGNYTLIAPIGSGGMGSVWLAQRNDGRFERQVAIKFLNLGLPGDVGAERFRLEGNILARLTHPNIARLLDAGVSATGQPYLVLDYIEGVPIDRWCEDRRLGVEARVRLFLDVLAAVAHAHSNLILHRDLKPLEHPRHRRRRGEAARLRHRQAARRGRAGRAGRRRSSRTLGRAFTPDYAAPEQIQGRAVTTATDVYALGVLLYVLLSGRHPTARPEATPLERLQAVIDREPTRLPLAAASPALARALAGDLENIVAKALRKAPEQRYASPVEMAEDLRRYLGSEPVAARPDSIGYRARKFVVRHRWGLAAAAAIGLALSVGAGVAAWQAVEANQRRAQAELEAKRATASLDLLYLAYSDPGAMPAKDMLERLAQDPPGDPAERRRAAGEADAARSPRRPLPRARRDRRDARGAGRDAHAGPQRRRSERARGDRLRLRQRLRRPGPVRGGRQGAGGGAAVPAAGARPADRGAGGVLAGRGRAGAAARPVGTGAARRDAERRDLRAPRPDARHDLHVGPEPARAQPGRRRRLPAELPDLAQGARRPEAAQPAGHAAGPDDRHAGAGHADGGRQAAGGARPARADPLRSARRRRPPDSAVRHRRAGRQDHVAPASLAGGRARRSMPPLPARSPPATGCSRSSAASAPSAP